MINNGHEYDPHRGSGIHHRIECCHEGRIKNQLGVFFLSKPMVGFYSQAHHHLWEVGWNPRFSLFSRRPIYTDPTGRM